MVLYPGIVIKGIQRRKTFLSQCTVRTKYCGTEHNIENILDLQTFRNIVSAEVA